jgi:hypothetical protein
VGIFVKTPECGYCHEHGLLELTDDQYERWLNRKGHIQNDLPDLTDGQRELLITGTHEPCWIAIFGNGEDEDEDGEEEVPEDERPF